jgi:hypothetical protein
MLLNRCRGSVLELGRATAVVLLCSACFAGGASADTQPRRQPPMHAIVNGRNLQPRGDQLQALGYSDLTRQEADEVDRLYRELMQGGTVARQRGS